MIVHNLFVCDLFSLSKRKISPNNENNSFLVPVLKKIIVILPTVGENTGEQPVELQYF